MSEKHKTKFAKDLNDLASRCFLDATERGFHDRPREFGTEIALITSELSEALEAERHGNPPDDKIPEYSGVEAELADTIIRILDTAGSRGLRLGEALEAKLEYNRSRPYKHGKKF